MSGKPPPIDVDLEDGDLRFVRICPAHVVRLGNGQLRHVPAVTYRHPTAEVRANYLNAEREALAVLGNTKPAPAV